MSHYNVSHHFAENLYAKEMQIPAGFTVGKHVHNFSHFSILAKGTVIVTVDEVPTRYEAPACVPIKAGCMHTVYAVIDSVWFCVHVETSTDATASTIDNLLLTRG